MTQPASMNYTNHIPSVYTHKTQDFTNKYKHVCLQWWHVRQCLQPWKWPQLYGESDQTVELIHCKWGEASLLNVVCFVCMGLNHCPEVIHSKGKIVVGVMLRCLHFLHTCSKWWSACIQWRYFPAQEVWIAWRHLQQPGTQTSACKVMNIMHLWIT